MGETAKPKIIADVREPEEICDALEAIGVEIDLKQLEVGDYVVSDRLAVERKTHSDFESSIIDGRLFSQASALCSAFSRPVMIIEGEKPNDSRLLRSSVLGAYSALISDFGITLFFTRSPYTTAELISSLARHEHSKNAKAPAHPKRKAVSLYDQQLRVVESLPGVGPSLAKALLEYFCTVENVMCAPESELSQVGKIGKLKAARLRQLLTKRFMPEKKEGKE